MMLNVLALVVTLCPTRTSCIPGSTMQLPATQQLCCHTVFRVHHRPMSNLGRLGRKRPRPQDEGSDRGQGNPPVILELNPARLKRTRTAQRQWEEQQVAVQLQHKSLMPPAVQQVPSNRGTPLQGAQLPAAQAAPTPTPTSTGDIHKLDSLQLAASANSASSAASHINTAAVTDQLSSALMVITPAPAAAAAATVAAAAAAVPPAG